MAGGRPGGTTEGVEKHPTRAGGGGRSRHPTRERVNALLQLGSGVVHRDLQVIFIFVPDDLQLHHLLLVVGVVSVANTRVLS